MNILFYDIETSTQEGHYFGNKWQTNILKTTREWSLLSVAWAWNDGPVQYADITMGPHYKQGSLNDFWLLTQLHSLFTAADVMVAHHGDKFDLPRMRTRFLVKGFDPIPPVMQVDTKKLAARAFGSYGQSNSLDDWCQRLGIGEKLQHQGIELWFSCQEGDPKAWKVMKRYNKHDVVLLRDLYHRIAPWIPTLNMGFFAKGETVCPTCGSHSLMKRGVRRTTVSEFQQFQCNDCKAYSRARARNPQRQADGTDIPLR